jgi:hypothetical protein
MELSETLELLRQAEIVGEGGKQRELVEAAIRRLAMEYRRSDGAAGTQPHHTNPYLVEMVS